MMDVKTEQESSLGVYQPHCFILRLASEVDLLPVNGAVMPHAVATHAHEYVHLLHNLTTMSGLHLFVANLWLLRLIPTKTDCNGHFAGQDALSNEHKLLATECIRWIRAILGGISPPKNFNIQACSLKWNFEKPVESIASFQLAKTHHKVEIVKVNAQVITEGGENHLVTIEIGHTLISEGIAYEVEREQNRLQGLDVDAIDARTYSYPYLAYGALLNHLVGRDTTPTERIQIGTLALLCTSPGMGLIDAARRLGRLVPKADQTQSVPSWVSDPILNGFKEIANSAIKRNLSPDLLTVGHGPIGKAAEEIETLFMAGFEKRTANPFLELMLCSAPLDPTAYRNVIMQLIDCCVLQSEPEGTARLEWIGPGLAAKDQEGAERLARLQSAMHFAQQHYSNTMLIPTQGITRKAMCPFTNACENQSRDEFPIACEVNPWTRYYGPTTHGCWYSAGVKLLAPRR